MTNIRCGNIEAIIKTRRGNPKQKTAVLKHTLDYLRQILCVAIRKDPRIGIIMFGRGVSQWYTHDQFVEVSQFLNENSYGEFDELLDDLKALESRLERIGFDIKNLDFGKVHEFLVSYLSAINASLDHLNLGYTNHRN